MISWIQRYFQHHFKTIFAILLIGTIISFVFTIGASPGLGRGDRRFVEREFFTYNLSLPDDQARLFGDAQLSASLSTGRFGGLDQDQIQNYAFQRAAALHLAAQWHIPAATSTEIADMVKTLPAFVGQDGQFDPKAYATFRDNLKTNPRGLTEAEIARVLGDDVRAEKVQKLLSGPGYILPHDVKTLLARSETTWALATGAVDYKEFKVDLKPADADLTKFFEENTFRYRIPPQVVAAYADFPSVNYLPAVSVTDAEVRAFYDANPSRFPKPPEVKPADDKKTDTPPKPDPAADFAAVKSQVELTLKLERAQKFAMKAATDLSLALYTNKVTGGAGLEAFLTKSKVTPKPLAPFARNAGPAELGGSPEIAGEAFKLNATRFYSEGLSYPGGAAVLFWKETQPERTPLLTEVREKVSTDYLEGERRKRFVELGKSIKSQVDARLKAGEQFGPAIEAVAKAAGVKVEAKPVPNFTLRNPPQDLDYSVMGSLDRLEKGQVSDMVVTADKGLFVYAADKQAPDLSETNPQYATTRTQLTTYTSRMGARAYIAEMVEAELKRTEPKAEKAN
ncbi:MAG: peptidyl-prolyl cis-trans isomerase [Verrucomicrobia bacterium]|nr:peptidyl-prolyl cis-trans isomerase [Verrucomicrobiota bacterium]